MSRLTPDAWLAKLTRAAGADVGRVALCPPLPGRWSSAGLSAVVAAQAVALGAGLATKLLTNANGYPRWGLAVGAMVYGSISWALWRGLPALLRQFDRPGPDRQAARWMVAGAVALAGVGAALALAVPFEIFLTGRYSLHDWLNWQEPAATLRWAVRGVGLAVLAVPLVARRGLARSAAYGTLCDTDFHLRQLTATRATAAL